MGVTTMTDRTPVLRGRTLSDASSLTKVAWVPKQEIEHPAWVTAGRQLGAIGRASQWWIGDWLLYGNARWGEKYAEAAKITGYDVGSLRNMASLASQFDSSRRRDNLTWSHHAAVASLAPEVQESWLDRAIAARMSVADVRAALRTAREARGDALSVTADRAEHHSDVGQPAVCPQCGYGLRPGAGST